LIFALQEALKIVKEEGLDNRIKRHDRIAKATRESVKAIGLTLFPKSEEICSKTVTAINAPEGIDEAELRKKMIDRFNIRLAGAQAHIKGKVFRIGHMGSVTEKELLQTLAALQECLKELGFNLKADPVEVAEKLL
jgi:aspartate aminotransferase-like enzyme